MRRVVRRVAKRTVYGTAGNKSAGSQHAVWAANSSEDAPVDDTPEAVDGDLDFEPAEAGADAAPSGLLDKLRASSTADRQLTEELAARGGSAKLANSMRAKIRERRERSLARVRAQLRVQGDPPFGEDASLAEGGGDSSLADDYATSETSSRGPLLAPESLRGGSTNSIDWRTLQRGEYVVHKAHGIGQFVGAKKLAAKPGQVVDIFLFIQYADGMAKLRASSAGRLLYRYRLATEAPTGADGTSAAKPVKLSRLDDPVSWQKKQEKGRTVIQRMVMTYMDTYLERFLVTRQPYPELEPELLTAFRAGFPYPLTPDQVAAVADIFDDMSRDTPMDRLVIGDVGFGKTEVALHAALRALASGTQVAILAPTTVLARQHAALVEKRFHPLGFPTASVTRFTSAAVRKDITARLYDKSIRLVVGTHTLLNDPQLCSSLGLLIIDEEQRFGVRQKETITSMSTKVDVLTMSATPIPRTLHMAMAGFRDASVIATPPPGRLPVHTQLLPASDEVIANAIAAERERNGQVFYVVPRITGIEAASERLTRLLPGVRLQTAHGRMKSSALESAMTSFAEGNEHDVLLCTTIVESGLDLPRVNTIIIEDAYMFGLASLYQLRGRVGRCALQAHALLLWDANKELTEDAKARLEAIRESCTALGGGFRVAERDMEIRGVGALFGDAQSGDVANVGTDLYLEILHDQLVSMEQCRLPAVAFDDVALKLEHLAGDIPPTMVASQADAKQLARKALDAGREGPSALKALAAEVEAATGKLPKPFHTLLRSHLLRYYASTCGIHSVEQGPLGVVHLRTAMGQRTFACINAMMSDADRALLTWKPAPGGKGSASVDLRVDVASSDAHTWGLTPEVLLEKAIAATASMAAAAPKFLKYN